MKRALKDGEHCNGDLLYAVDSPSVKMTYSAFSEEIDSPILGKYRTYSIAVTDAEGRRVRTVHDVSQNREAIESLTAQCNRLALSLCHLDDVIEDFLG